MKQGMTLEKLASQLDYENEHKRDFIVDTATLRAVVDGQKDISISWTDKSRGRPHKYAFPTTDHMLGQIAAHTLVPMKLLRQMLTGTPAEQKELGRLLTTRLKENPANRMIRTIMGDQYLYARAFLSDRYRAIDNYEVLNAIFPVIKKHESALKIASCDVTETRMYIKLRYPLLKGKLGRVRDDSGAEIDDIVEAGVIISNSEVGAGPVKIQLFLHRLVCKNGATAVAFKRGSRKIHVGRQLSPDEMVVGYDNSEYLASLAQAVKDVLADKKMFKRLVAQFKEAKTRPIRDEEAAVRVLAKTFKMSDEERDLVLSHLRATFRTGKKTQFDLINAVTRAGQNKELSYDRASEFEEIGGKLIDMGDRAWKKIGNARPKVEDIFA